MAQSNAVSTFGREMLAVSRIWRRAIGQRMSAETGLPDAQWLIVDTLAQQGDSVSQQTIAERLGLEKSAMVRVLNDLEEAGLVTRIDAGRNRLVGLSEAGRDKARIIAEIAQQFDRQATDGIGPDEMQLLLKALHHLRLNAAKLT